MSNRNSLALLMLAVSLEKLEKARKLNESTPEPEPYPSPLSSDSTTITNTTTTTHDNQSFPAPIHYHSTSNRDWNRPETSTDSQPQSSSITTSTTDDNTSKPTSKVISATAVPIQSPDYSKNASSTSYSISSSTSISTLASFPSPVDFESNTDVTAAYFSSSPSLLQMANYTSKDYSSLRLAQDFSKKTWKEDLTIVADGKKLYASKTVLALVSPVFETMFTNTATENKEQIIRLTDKSYESVLEFLKCVYPDPEVEYSVTPFNVYQVLPLADEYQVKTLKDRCEKTMINIIQQPNPPISQLLKCLAVSERYNLLPIRDQCMQVIEKKDPMELANADFDPSCKDAMVKLLKKMLVKQNNHLKTLKMFIPSDIDLDKDLSKEPFHFTNLDNVKGAVMDFTVPNVSQGQSSASAVVELWGFQFTAIVICPLLARTDRDLAFYIRAKPLSDDIRAWSCRVRARLFLKSLADQMISGGDPTRAFDRELSAERDNWGFKDFATVSDVVLRRSRNDEIRLSAVIVIDPPRTVAVDPDVGIVRHVTEEPVDPQSQTTGLIRPSTSFKNNQNNFVRPPSFKQDTNLVRPPSFKTQETNGVEQEASS